VEELKGYTVLFQITFVSFVLKPEIDVDINIK